jgi:hypothetical protein
MRSIDETAGWAIRLGQIHGLGLRTRVHHTTLRAEPKQETAKDLEKDERMHTQVVARIVHTLLYINEYGYPILNYVCITSHTVHTRNHLVDKMHSLPTTI